MHACSVFEPESNTKSGSHVVMFLLANDSRSLTLFLVHETRRDGEKSWAKHQLRNRTRKTGLWSEWSMKEQRGKLCNM